MFKGIQKFRYTGQNTTYFKEYKYLGILDKTLHFYGIQELGCTGQRATCLKEYKSLGILGKTLHILRNTRT